MAADSSTGKRRGNQTKRPHFVPKAYSQAWANASGRVAVRRRDLDGTFVTSINNVGVAAGIYGSGLMASHREGSFGAVEAHWPRLRSLLVASGHLASSDRPTASLFIGLQIVRTRERLASDTFVEDLVEAFPGRPLTKANVRTFIRDRHAHDPDDSEVEAAWTFASYLIERGGIRSFDEAFSMTMDVALKGLVPLIDELHWRVEVVDKPVLWMSDRPVMPWRPPSDADAYEGVGYGDCHEVRMPLSPSAMLVMTKQVPREVRVGVPERRFHEYNEDIAAQCHEFIACTPGRAGRLSTIPLARSRPAVRFNLGPGFNIERDGTPTPMGDVLHTWIPLRAGA